MNTISNFLIKHLQESYELACINISQIDEGILNIDGLSGVKNRHFYNNIANFNECRYLEIGTWKGGSVCAAMSGNKSTIVCIDNWSQFNGPKDEFMVNFNKYMGENKATFIEADCFLFDKSLLGKFNVYMYDGSHDEKDHFRAIDELYDNLDDHFIYIVDDWNWEKVRKGTEEAIRKRNLEIIHKIEVYPPVDERTAMLKNWRDRFDKENWWNGLGAFVLKKSKFKVDAVIFNLSKYKTDRYTLCEDTFNWILENIPLGPILEFGSGYSTDIFSELGYDIVSIEDDESYLKEKSVLVTLKDGWYDIDLLEPIVNGKIWNLVIVDGPQPKSCQGRLNFINHYKKLGLEQIPVVIDDTNIFGRADDYVDVQAIKIETNMMATGNYTIEFAGRSSCLLPITRDRLPHGRCGRSRRDG